MKILFLSSWFPYPPINGAKIRIYNLIRQLAKHHEVTLLSFAKTIPIEEAQNNLPILRQYCCEVEVIPAISFEPESRAAYRGFLSLRPRSVIQTYSLEMDKLIQEKINSNSFDVVVVSEVGEPSNLSLLASKISGIPIILDALEIGLPRDRYYGQISKLPRIRGGLTWYKLRNFTREVIRQADACTVPSLPEKQNLLEIYPQHPQIRVIPHCLDMPYYSGFNAPPRANSLVFTGSFTYHPNFDAASYFLKDIYPQIKASIPKAQLKIIGSTKGVPLTSLPNSESVNFTGLIKDVRPPVAQSWLSVVPLRIGAGTRLKIIESMALGTPVVSTSKGAEGLEVTHGKNILIADNPEKFARAVIQVLQDPGLRKNLSLSGRRLVEERYSADYMGQEFVSLLDHIAQSRKYADPDFIPTQRYT